MIVEYTRGHIRFKLGDRTVTLHGEMCFPTNPGGHHFVVWRSYIRNWDPPFDAEAITEETQAKILDELRGEFAKEGMVLGVD
jgi:hypothetical protein